MNKSTFLILHLLFIFPSIFVSFEEKVDDCCLSPNLFLETSISQNSIAKTSLQSAQDPRRNLVQAYQALPTTNPQKNRYLLEMLFYSEKEATYKEFLSNRDKVPGHLLNDFHNARSARDRLIALECIRLFHLNVKLKLIEIDADSLLQLKNVVSEITSTVPVNLSADSSNELVNQSKLLEFLRQYERFKSTASALVLRDLPKDDVLVIEPCDHDEKRMLIINFLKWVHNPKLHLLVGSLLKLKNPEALLLVLETIKYRSECEVPIKEYYEPIDLLRVEAMREYALLFKQVLVQAQSGNSPDAKLVTSLKTKQDIILSTLDILKIIGENTFKNIEDIITNFEKLSLELSKTIHKLNNEKSKTSVLDDLKDLCEVVNPQDVVVSALNLGVSLNKVKAENLLLQKLENHKNYSFDVLLKIRLCVESSNIRSRQLKFMLCKIILEKKNSMLAMPFLNMVLLLSEFNNGKIEINNFNSIFKKFQDIIKPDAKKIDSKRITLISEALKVLKEIMARSDIAIFYENGEITTSKEKQKIMGEVHSFLREILNHYLYLYEKWKPDDQVTQEQFEKEALLKSENEVLLSRVFHKVKKVEENDKTYYVFQEKKGLEKKSNEYYIEKIKEGLFRCLCALVESQDFEALYSMVLRIEDCNLRKQLASLLKSQKLFEVFATYIRYMRSKEGYTDGEDLVRYLFIKPPTETRNISSFTKIRQSA